jgi:hypothetical protein
MHYKKPHWLKSLWENSQIGNPAAKAVLILRIYVVAKATTHKDFPFLTRTLKAVPRFDQSQGKPT